MAAALQDYSGSRDRAAKRAGRGRGGEPQQKRARSVGVDAGGGGGSSAPATAPAASLVDVTVEDADALDCVVCYLPLKPPIFQCDVGHAVCSLCHDKLQATGKCPVCRVVTSRYRRCHVLERLVDSIRVPCPNAAHGCALKPVYYDQESHRSVCVHAPCHCPGEACSFVGSTAALLDHCSTAHKWPCTTTEPDDKDRFNLHLRDGFNFLLADCPTGIKNQRSSASIRCLLLLTVARQPFVRIISVHCIDPHAAVDGHGVTSKEMLCNLSYNLSNMCIVNDQLIDHWQVQGSRFRVVRTDLSNGVPKPDDCLQVVVVPNSVIEDHDKGINVQVGIIIG